MKKIFIFLTIFYFLLSNTFANENIFIEAKINNKIITNLDLKKEINYLNILNPQLENLDKKKKKIAKNSLINEIIKKWIKKIFWI